MKTSPPATNRHKTASLNERIRHAERQLSSRQRQVDSATTSLINTIHHQITRPASLLLASGAGFIIGELTKCQTPRASDATERTNASGTTTPLMVLLNLMATVHTLYTALPLVWVIKSFYQSAPSQPRHRSANNG